MGNYTLYYYSILSDIGHNIYSCLPAGPDIQEDTRQQVAYKLFNWCQVVTTDNVMSTYLPPSWNFPSPLLSLANRVSEARRDTFSLVPQLANEGSFNLWRHRLSLCLCRLNKIEIIRLKLPLICSLVTLITIVSLWSLLASQTIKKVTSQTWHRKMLTGHYLSGVSATS